ncbi:MAG: GIY-YIG nuclease family protein [Nitrospirae bacterium]|nr:GIY-YIG nuclease family protein [Nitrospirota bacterium]
MVYFVYVLKSGKAGTSYIGHSSDLTRRVAEHNSGRSLSTRNRGPWELVYKEAFQTRSEAIFREKYFKTVKGRMELKESGII